MKRFGLVVLAFLLLVFPAFAQVWSGVVVAVDKKKLTIQDAGGAKKTLRFGPDMGKKHNEYVPEGIPLGVTPDQIKPGMIVHANCQGKEEGLLVCRYAYVTVLRLGTREIDFAPMLAKDKDKVAPCKVHIKLESRAGLTRFRPTGGQAIIYKDGASVKRIRDDFKKMLENDEWKVKAEGDSKLLIEAYKKEEVQDVVIEAVRFPEDRKERFPKEQQPRVRRLDSRDPSKDKKDK